MSNILISIIMPAYNAEKYIKESIDSILNQSFKNWELIIINDGSQDNTETMVKNYDDKRITLISQKNGGVSSARNRGLEIAQGKYVTFLDADDTFPKDSLKSRFEYLESNPNIDLVDGIVNVKDINLDKIIRTYTPYYEGELLPELLRLNDKVFLGICYFFKSSSAKDLRFNESITHGEDLLFYIQLSNSCNIKYSYVKEKIYNYRSSNNSAMANLKGLELGYIELLREIKKLNCTTSLQWWYLKLKIMKIMFLSWLSQKKYNNAISSIFNILFLKESI